MPFYPFNNTKSKNFEKLEKRPGDIVILHKCTNNHDHMLYCSLDMVCNKCYFYFSLWAIFCHFNSLTAQKIKILKKNPWRYHHFTIVYQKSRLYAILFVSEIWCVTDVIIFHFGSVFALLFLPKKSKLKKKTKKNAWRYHHFT